MPTDESPKQQAPIKVEIVHGRTGLIEHVSTWTPIFVSALALSLTIWSAHEQRIHDRIMVAPRIISRIERGPNLAPNEPALGLILENDGLGSADVREIHWFLDGKEMKESEIADNTIGIYRHPAHYLFATDLLIRSGVAEYLISVDPVDIVNWSAFADFLHNRLVIKAQICSIYEECSMYCTPSWNALCR